MDYRAQTYDGSLENKFEVIKLEFVFRKDYSKQLGWAAGSSEVCVSGKGITLAYCVENTEL